MLHAKMLRSYSLSLWPGLQAATRAGIACALAAILVTACSSSRAPASHGETSDAFEAMPAEAQREVRESVVVPMLFPPRLGENAQATTGPTWVSVNTRDGEVAYLVQGQNQTHHEIDGVTFDFPHEVHGQPAMTTINEGIRVLTWREGGVSYSLEVECVNDIEDPRCAEETHALELAAELTAFGASSGVAQ